MSRVEGGKKSGEKENELLSKDVETINEAPCREKKSSTNSTSSKTALHDPKSKAKANKEDNLRKDKKSIWGWKPLKALSLTRNKRFNCCFTLQVHLIEGLPLSFNNYSLCVFWKRKDVLLATPPAKVIQGVAEFQQILAHTFSICGSKSGPHNSAKYEAKYFLVYASTPGAPKLDLGKHRVDLTRLLPLTLEELEEEKTSGKWTTTFRLSGTAKGAVMNVSFGYAIVPDNTSTPPNLFTSRVNSMPLMDPDTKPSQVERNVRRAGSLPCFTSPHYSSQDVVDVVKDLHEVLPSSESARVSLYKNFDEEKRCNLLHDKPEPELYKENPKPIKPAVRFSSDSEKGKSEETPGNEGKTCSLVHHKPEFDGFRENLQIVGTNDYPLPDSGIESSKECEGNGFSIVDQGQGTNFSSNEHVKLEESIIKAVVDVHTVDRFDTDVIQVSFEDSAKHDSLDELNDSSRESAAVPEISNRMGVLCTKEIMQELESALNRVSELESLAVDSPITVEAKYENRLRKSQSLDDFAESVASEFLSKLGIDHSPMGVSFESEFESPRERLLRQFEKEVLSEGFSLFNFDTGNDNEADGGYGASFGSEQWKFSAGIKSVSSLPDLQKEYLIESEDVRSKQKVQMLVDLETEALMHEWRLNEKAFQHSPPKDFNGFGSPIYFLPEEPLPLPPLEEGMGPFLQTKDGGFLRSLNPSLFRNSKTGGRLIMQVSNPVVMPAEMGSRIMEILQCLASVGIEKLSMQANKLMPLEEITGKTMQQISWEAKSALEGTHSRQFHLQHDLVTEQESTCAQKGLKGILPGGLKTDKFCSSSVDDQKGSEFASLEDLSPLAMDKIEALSVEGLRIQSGMSKEDAPSNIIAQTFGDISALQGKGVSINGSLGLDGAAALHLLNLKDSSNDGVDGIMGLSLTLDEWMRLDSGDFDDIDNISEHTSKLLAAHHANSFDFNRGSPKGEKKRGKGSGRKCGLLGNNFTVALMVQLRDPLRNYEAVGTPMLALIQVEREFVPPKHKIYRRVSEVGNINDEDDECEIVAKVEMKVNKEDKSSEEEAIPQFRITEVHVAGLKTEPEAEARKKKVWGTSRQQQSGSRWLIANGMGKNSNNLFMKSKPVSKTSAPTTKDVQHSDTLWSISSRIFGTGTRWKELAELNPHVRNPNIIIPNKTTRVS
ncbi:protein PLASTID MOVEMENT IMPAIRED 1-RELATED 1 [Cajanus cajan]|uniref:protein PLASTID MOVEMENT IMPAIRED 1-RELATED 1 n=1 Tax=Cajanus cajan TaxID=3821 RepID=UPI00098D7695|nr:protein PLASTID MOVEMENT IMPAIRED 1-RELATED 1 [Cajanus cajan]